MNSAESTTASHKALKPSRHISKQRIEMVMIANRAGANSTEICLEIEGMNEPRFSTEIYSGPSGERRFVGYLIFELCNEINGTGLYMLDDILGDIPPSGSTIPVVYSLGANLSFLSAS